MRKTLPIVTEKDKHKIREKVKANIKKENKEFIVWVNRWLEYFEIPEEEPKTRTRTTKQNFHYFNHLFNEIDPEEHYWNVKETARHVVRNIVHHHEDDPFILTDVKEWFGEGLYPQNFSDDSDDDVPDIVD